MIVIIISSIIYYPYYFSLDLWDQLHISRNFKLGRAISHQRTQQLTQVWYHNNTLCGWGVDKHKHVKGKTCKRVCSGARRKMVENSGYRRRRVFHKASIKNAKICAFSWTDLQSSISPHAMNFQPSVSVIQLSVVRNDSKNECRIERKGKPWISRKKLRKGKPEDPWVLTQNDWLSHEHRVRNRGKTKYLCRQHVGKGKSKVKANRLKTQPPTSATWLSYNNVETTVLCWWYYSSYSSGLCLAPSSC